MTERQRRFCAEFLVDLCATRAARRAGYSETTARSAPAWIHPKHPRKPELRAEIDRMLAKRALRTQVDANQVVRELAKIAFEGADAAPDGAKEAAPPETEGGEPPKRGRSRSKAQDGVRTQDRLRALELLGKHLGVFAERAHEEQAQPVIVDDTGGPDELEGAGEGGGGDA